MCIYCRAPQLPAESLQCSAVPRRFGAMAAESGCQQWWPAQIMGVTRKAKRSKKVVSSWGLPEVFLKSSCLYAAKVHGVYIQATTTEGFDVPPGSVTLSSLESWSLWVSWCKGVGSECRVMPCDAVCLPGESLVRGWCQVGRSLGPLGCNVWILRCIER